MNRKPLPAHTISPYSGTQRTVDAMLKLADGPRGAQSLRLRQLVESIIRDIDPRDKLSQLAAIYHWYEAHHTYTYDPIPTELVRDPVRVLEDIEENGRFLGDCDDAATFITGASRSIGIRAYPVRVGFRKPMTYQLGGVSVKGPAPYSHVLAVAHDQYGRTVVIDPVAGDRTWKMLRRTKTYG